MTDVEDTTRCQGTYGSGRRCANRALKGDDFCHYHEPSRYAEVQEGAARARAHVGAYDHLFPEADLDMLDTVADADNVESVTVRVSVTLKPADRVVLEFSIKGDE